jgi:hypothetical protein
MRLSPGVCAEAGIASESAEAQATKPIVRRRVMTMKRLLDRKPGSYESAIPDMGTMPAFHANVTCRSRRGDYLAGKPIPIEIGTGVN